MAQGNALLESGHPASETVTVRGAPAGNQRVECRFSAQSYITAVTREWTWLLELRTLFDVHLLIYKEVRDVSFSGGGGGGGGGGESPLKSYHF